MRPLQAKWQPQRIRLNIVHVLWLERREAAPSKALTINFHGGGANGSIPFAQVFIDLNQVALNETSKKL